MPAHNTGHKQPDFEGDDEVNYRIKKSLLFAHKAILGDYIFTGRILFLLQKLGAYIYTSHTIKADIYM